MLKVLLHSLQPASREV